MYSDWEEIFVNGPFSGFFKDFEIFNGLFLIILHRLQWAIFQVNGTMAHGPLPSPNHLWCNQYVHFNSPFIKISLADFTGAFHAWFKCIVSEKKKTNGLHLY